MISREMLAKLCQWFKGKSFVVCCGIAPVFILSAFLLTCNFGYNVIVNGEVIGTAPSKEYVYNLIDSINDELSPYLGGNDAINVEPAMTPKIVVGKDFTKRQKLGESLKKYCPYLEKAYSVKSNGKTVVAFKTKKERKKCYDTFISNMTKNSSSYEILDTITFEHELVPYGLIKTGKGALIMLERTYEFDKTVEINKNCTLSDILSTYAMNEDDFFYFNPDFEEGKTTSAVIYSDIPYIRVASVEKYIQGEILPYGVTYEEDDTVTKGTTEIIQDGKDGFVKTHVTKYAVNGKSIYEKVGKTNTTEATPQVLLVGTKEFKSGSGTGLFEKPCTGVLTSRYGQRGGRMHKGVDIGGPEGTPIVAADSGTVVYAGWDDGGFGNMVKIDHGNGIITLYAHCNDIFVKKGDYVSKGETISSMGNTGRSTGSHLHFEVIDTNGGSNIDPLEFFEI